MIGSGELLPAAALTFSRAVLGLCIASLFGVALAVASDLSPSFRKGFAPIAEALQSLPPAAVVPMAIFSLGLGLKLYAFIVVLVAAWPPYFNSVAALKAVSDVQLQTGRMLGLSGFGLLLQIKLPSVLPEIFGGIRYAAAISVIATIVAEMLAGHDGVGSLLVKRAFAQRSSDVFALMFATALTGVALAGLVNVCRFLTTYWHVKLMERQA
jgi:ABC-type nitrate/sulfonate/bicarbonate transport system permease component